MLGNGGVELDLGLLLGPADDSEQSVKRTLLRFDDGSEGPNEPLAAIQPEESAGASTSRPSRKGYSPAFGPLPWVI